MNNSDYRVVKPSTRIGGVIRVPGDKSISHRAAMLLALAEGLSTIEGFLVSEDCLNTLRAVEALGARVTREGTRVEIQGTGGWFKAASAELDMGNSGTGIRLLAGLLAGQPFISQMSGDASLRARPMRRIQDPLERMGAQVELLGPNGCAPVRIHGGGLSAIWYQLPMASAQVKSCALLAGLFGRGRTSVMEPKPTRDHTERILRQLGVDVVVDGLTISVNGDPENGLRIPATNLVVPGDFSSAAFWMAAAACREGSKVTMTDVGMNPRRIAFLNVLKRMGADIEIRMEDGSGEGARAEVRGGKVAPVLPAASGEERGTVIVRGRRLHGTEVGGDEIPNLIDELPLVGVVGALAEGRTTVREAAELRVKESDRIAAMCAVLTAFGVKVDEKPDGMVVHGGGRIAGGAQIASRGDHRIAMCAAILTLFADSPVQVNEIGCIATSYPSFWTDMETVTGQIE